MALVLAASAIAFMVADASYDPKPPPEDFSRVAVFVAYDRYEYFYRSFDAFIAARGAEKYDILVFVDGEAGRKPEDAFDREGWLAIQKHAYSASFLASRGAIPVKSVKLVVAPSNLGVWKNKKRAVAAAMERAEFAIVLEDDIVVSRDAIDWLEFPVTSGMAKDPRISTATCWSTSFPATPDPTLKAFDRLAVETLGMRDQYFENPHATPWGWSVWRSTWARVGSEWTGSDADFARLARERGMVELMPLLARCDNVGAHGSTMRGAAADPVHGRALTSGDLPDAPPAFHPAKSVRSPAAEVADYERIYSLVRHGIEDDVRSLGAGLGELETRLRLLRAEVDA
jgi:hypothetical protein